MEKITTLTQEQKDLFPVYRDKWLNIGLCTDPLDRDATREAISEFYISQGYKPPKKIEFFDGITEGKKAGIQNKDIWAGQFSAYWISFYDYMYEVLNIGIGKELLPIINVAKNSGIISFQDDFCNVIERPELIKMENGVLHNETGPSIRFRDGFEVYSWRGTRVPKEWILDKDSVDVNMALTWDNIEQRRALAEIVGWDNVIAKLKNVSVIDADDPEIGTLLEVDIPEIGRERFIRVFCGTGRQFALPVPPNTETALGAQAFLHNIPLEEFLLPEIRT